MPDKTYKEINGTTRVGDALRWMKDAGKKFGPDLLDIAGKVTGVSALNVLSDKIDSDTNLSKEDKMMLKANIEMDKLEMKNISNRWKYDMQSDSWLSKNVRPLCIIALTIMLFVFVILDSALDKFTVDKEWIFLHKAILLTVYAAYFGSRTVEKVNKTRQNR